MSIPAEIPPPAPPAAVTPTSRQRTTVYLACTLLVLCAFVLLFVPSAKIPLPGRLFLAAIDLVAAATLALIVRQKSKPPA